MVPKLLKMLSISINSTGRLDIEPSSSGVACVACRHTVTNFVSTRGQGLEGGMASRPPVWTERPLLDAELLDSVPQGSKAHPQCLGRRRLIVSGLFQRLDD